MGGAGAPVAGISVRSLTVPWCHAAGHATYTPAVAGPVPRMGLWLNWKDRLRADLTGAMRARDQVRMRTLRMALTSITNEEVAELLGPRRRADERS